MSDFLSKLIDDANRRVHAGYYDIQEGVKHEPVSLKRVIKSAEKNAIIAEIKPISPALGPLRPDIDPIEAAAKLVKGGAVALSVLTEPDNFGGSLDNFRMIRSHVTVPLLMKDIIIHTAQVHAAKKVGADCILLIGSAFQKHPKTSLVDMIHAAHQSQLEVLLEVHSEDELGRALKSEADVVGVNNRNLATLEIDLNTTARLMAKVNERVGKVLISESGFESADDVRRVKPAIMDGFLIGSSIMLSQDLESKVREFVLA